MLCWGTLRVGDLLPLVLSQVGFGPQSLEYILLLVVLPVQRGGMDSPAEEDKDGVSPSGNFP